MLTCGARDLVLDLLRQRIKLTLGEAQRFHVIAQHALRGLLHAFLQIIDLATRLLLELSRLAVEAALEQLARHVQRIIRLPLAILPQRVVKLFGQERLDRLGLLRNVLHALEQIRKTGALLLQLVRQLLALAGIRQRLLLLVAE